MPNGADVIDDEALPMPGPKPNGAEGVNDVPNGAGGVNDVWAAPACSWAAGGCIKRGLGSQVTFRLEVPPAGAVLLADGPLRPV